MTAGRGKREYGLFLSLCYHPKLALDHTFSLFLTSKWATWVSGSAKILRDNRHEKTHPQASITKSSPRHTQKNKSQLVYYFKSLWDMLCSLKQCKNFAKWQTLCCETHKYCTVSHPHLQNISLSMVTTSRTQNLLLYLNVFSLTVQHCVLGAMQQEISEKNKPKH